MDELDKQCVYIGPYGAVQEHGSPLPGSIFSSLLRSIAGAIISTGRSV